MILAWLLAALGVFLATLAAGIWTGWVARGEHDEDSAAVKAPAAADGDHGTRREPPWSPLTPFPAQWALEIEDEPFQGRTWLDTLLEENGVARDCG